MLYYEYCNTHMIPKKPHSLINDHKKNKSETDTVTRYQSERTPTVSTVLSWDYESNDSNIKYYLNIITSVTLIIILYYSNRSALVPNFHYISNLFL